MSEQSLVTIRNFAKSDMVIDQFVDMFGGKHGAMGYIADVLLTVANKPALQECTPQSIMNSALRAASMRLSCDESSGEAYLSPYNVTIKEKDGSYRKEKQCQLIVGYKGIYRMAMRTNKYRFINVARIRKGQTIEEDQMTGLHTIKGFNDRNQPVIGHMLYFQLTNGFQKTIYMTVEEIHAHAAKNSPSYNFRDGAWKTNTDTMEQKTVLRLGLGKWGYFDPKDKELLRRDEESNFIDADFVEDETVVEREPIQSTGEILSDLDDKPDPRSTPEPTPQPTQTNSAKLTRPLLPSQLQDSLKKKAEGKGNKPASKEQRSLAAMLLNQIFQDEAHRHTFQLYACGAASLADLPDGMILALLDWLEPKKDSGGMYYANADSEKEARMAYTEALKAEGQAELFEGV